MSERNVLFWVEGDISDEEIRALNQEIESRIDIVRGDENPEIVIELFEYIIDPEKYQEKLKSSLGWGNPELVLLVLDGALLLVSERETLQTAGTKAKSGVQSTIERMFGDAEEVDEEEAEQLVEEYTLGGDNREYT